MASRRREPVWLSRVIVDAIHDDQLREHGGLRGTRGETALESALARPQQRWHYTRADVPALAASYAYGLVSNHAYSDGNKRIGFLAMATFLGINGYELTATEGEVVTTFFALAGGQLSEDALVGWVRERSTKRR